MKLAVTYEVARNDDHGAAHPPRASAGVAAAADDDATALSVRVVRVGMGSPPPEDGDPPSKWHPAWQALGALLNEYVGGMTDVVFAHEGTVAKIIGDAIQILFNAPGDQPDYAARAIAWLISRRA